MKTLDDIGISKDQSARWQKLADIPDKKFASYLAGNAPTMFAWSMNGQRRQLTKSQQAALAVKMLPALQREAEKRMLAGKSDPTPELAEGRGEATKQAADLVGVGRTSAKALADRG